MENEQSIQYVLESIAHCKNIVIVNTEKNRHTRYLLNITIQDQEHLIRSLKYEDFLSGPEIDHDPKRSGVLWKFKKTWGSSNESVIIYIKLKVINETSVKVISCHIDNITV